MTSIQKKPDNLYTVVNNSFSAVNCIQKLLDDLMLFEMHTLFLWNMILKNVED